jgi:hypothetical protein
VCCVSLTISTTNVMLKHSIYLWCGFQIPSVCYVNLCTRALCCVVPSVDGTMSVCVWYSFQVMTLPRPTTFYNVQCQFVWYCDVSLSIIFL